MLSDEEKEAVEEIKKDSEYYDILENIKQNKYNMWNVEKLMRDTTTCDFTEYEIAQSIVYFVNQVEKQSKEIEEYKKQLDLDNADKKWENKIKAKIEEVDIQLQKLKDELTGRKTNFVNKNMLFAQKKALQSLLEKE